MEYLNSTDMNISEDLSAIVEESIRKLTELTAEDFDKKVHEKPIKLENEKFTSRFELQEACLILVYLLLLINYLF